MNLIAEIRYLYLFAFLIIFTLILLLTCIKITNCIFDMFNRDRYVWYMKLEQHYDAVMTFPKITVLSVVGILDSIALFTIISKLMY